MNNEIVKENIFKRFIKNHKVALIVWGAVLTLVALFASKFVYDITSAIIPDKNGDEDFSVVTITDEEIRDAHSGNYGGIGNGQFHEGEKSNVTGFMIEDVDYDMTRYNSLSMNGIIIANVTKTAADSMNLHITSNVESGNMEIFVFIDDELYREVKINEETDIHIEGISEKTVYVKAACESAKMSIEVEREILN